MGRVYSVINPMLENQKAGVQKTLNLSDFKLELKKKGIELTTKRTQTGEKLNSIYGLIFEDIKSHVTYTATDLKLKTNEIMKLIKDDEKIKTQEKQKSVKEENFTPVVSNEDNSSKNNSISFALELFSSLLRSSFIANDNCELPKKRKRRRYR